MYPNMFTLPETNIAPENGWLEDVPFLNDFAHIPWEDTPDFPKPLQGKKFLQKLLVKGLGYLPGVRG